MKPLSENFIKHNIKVDKDNRKKVIQSFNHGGAPRCGGVNSAGIPTELKILSE